MHELSIAMEILDIVRKEASTQGASAITGVNLKIGVLGGVETDSLAFCFDAVKMEHPLTLHAELTIENVPVIVQCKTCKDEFNTGGHLLTCPSCGGLDTRLLTGEELEIVDIEID